jgi:hypothetical protein
MYHPIKGNLVGFFIILISNGEWPKWPVLDQLQRGPPVGTAVTGPNTKADTKTDAAVDAENRKLDRKLQKHPQGM